MVSTQAQSIFLALLAPALVAGALGGAAAMPGHGGETDVTVGGSVRGDAGASMADAGMPGAGESLPRDAGVRMRAYDVVVPNPAARVREAGYEPAASVPTLDAADRAAVTFQLPDRATILPWGAMVDEDAIRASGASWEASSPDWIAYGEAVYLRHAHGMPLAMTYPGDLLAERVPEVHLRAAVEKIAWSTVGSVLLTTEAQGTAPPRFDRPDAPSALLAAPPGTRSDSGLPPAEAAYAAMPAGLAALAKADAGKAEGGKLPVRGASVAPLAGAVPFHAAVAGTASVIAGMALYHLIRKSAILKNKVRGTIAEYVLHRPGSTITEIAQAVGVTHQTASYHLRLLQEHGLVIGVERGNKRLYFRNDGSFNQEERGLVAVLRDPESMRVLALIRQNPWIMKNEAAAALGVSRNTLNWHLQKLLSAGLVSEARENGHCFLFAIRRASDDLLQTVAAKVEERKGDAPAEGAPQPPEMGLQPAPMPPSMQMGLPERRVDGA